MAGAGTACAARPGSRRRRRPCAPLALLAAAAAAVWAAYAPPVLEWLVPTGSIAAPRVVPTRGAGRGTAVARHADLMQVPGDVKNGLKILIDGTPAMILSFMSKKVGKGVAITKTKVQNLYTGAIVDKTLQSGSKYEVIDTEWKDAQYSYFNPGSNSYVFMDTETYDEMELSAEVLGESADWLTDGALCDVETYDGRYITFRFKEDIIVEVVSTSSSDRVDGDQKCTLSNGITKGGPSYLKKGDKVIINPKTFDITKRA